MLHLPFLENNVRSGSDELPLSSTGRSWTPRDTIDDAGSLTKVLGDEGRAVVTPGINDEVGDLVVVDTDVGGKVGAGVGFVRWVKLGSDVDGHVV